MKMSMPLGGRTITTTVTGGGDNVVKLLVLAAAIALPLTIIVAWATQIEIALTILATLGLIAVVAKPTYCLLTELYWPWERRQVRAFSAQVDAAFAAEFGPQVRHTLALEPAAPIRVESYVVEPDREREPVNLDELGR